MNLEILKKDIDKLIKYCNLKNIPLNSVDVTFTSDTMNVNINTQKHPVILDGKITSVKIKGTIYKDEKDNEIENNILKKLGFKNEK